MSNKKLNQGVALLVVIVIPLLIFAAAGSTLYLNSLLKQEPKNNFLENEPERAFEYTPKPERNGVSDNNKATSTTIKVDTKTATPTEVKVTPPPDLKGNFQSYGVIEIEGGAKVQITGAKKANNVLTVQITFSNPTNSEKQVAPLRTSMRSATYGYPPDPAPSPLTIQPGKSKSFSFQYEAEEDPPYRWVYSNTGGVQVDLAKYE